jgi:hypothetical protein
MTLPMGTTYGRVVYNPPLRSLASINIQLFRQGGDGEESLIPAAELPAQQTLVIRATTSLY